MPGDGQQAETTRPIQRLDEALEQFEFAQCVGVPIGFDLATGLVYQYAFTASEPKQSFRPTQLSEATFFAPPNGRPGLPSLMLTLLIETPPTSSAPATRIARCASALNTLAHRP